MPAEPTDATRDRLLIVEDDATQRVGLQKLLTSWGYNVEVARDGRGFVLTGPELATVDGGPPWPLTRQPFALETSVPGVFAAGDVRLDSMKRVASAVGEGAMAVYLIHRYLATI